MDVEEFPPPPPEMLADDVPFADEEEGEAFEFEDSGDETPEADRPPPAPPAPDYTDQGQFNGVAPHPEGQPPNPDPPAPDIPAATPPAQSAEAASPGPPDTANTTNTANTADTAAVATAEGEVVSAVVIGTDDKDTDLPLPPEEATPTATDAGVTGSWET